MSRHPPPPQPPRGQGGGKALASPWPCPCGPTLRRHHPPATGRPPATDRPTRPSIRRSRANRPVSCDTTSSLVCFSRVNRPGRLECSVRATRPRDSVALYHANRLRRGLVRHLLSSSIEFSARRVVARCAWMLPIFRNGHVSGDSVVCVGRLRARWHRTVEPHASSVKPPPVVRGQSGSCAVYLS